MGRQVVADPALETYLKSLCKLQEITVGLIIGQPCPNAKDVVVHFARTKHTAEETQKPESITQIDSIDVVEHALNVLKTLPGGFYIFGIFVVAPKDIFNDHGKVKSLILNLQHNLKASPLLGSTDDFDQGEKLVFWYSSSNNSYLCKSVSSDGSKGSQFKAVDWKFTSKPVTWLQVETFYTFDQVFQLDAAAKNTEEAIKRPVEDLSNRISKSLIFYNGIPLKQDETLEKLVADQTKKEVTADIYQTTEKCDQPLPVENYSSTVQFHGTVCSRIWVPLKTHLTHIDTFIKADLSRSLCTRLQILTDSLVDNKIPQSAMVISEPPRRVFYCLNKHEPVQFCDYLFPHEPVKTIVQQAKEHLDLDLKIDQVQAGVEQMAEAPKAKDVPGQSEVAKQAGTKKKSSKLYIILTVAAMLVLLLSIFLHVLLN